MVECTRKIIGISAAAGGIGLVIIIASIVGVHHSGGGEGCGGGAETKVWNGLCIQCQAKDCLDGEPGTSKQCLEGTMACIYATGDGGTISRHCGPLDELPSNMKMNKCVETNGKKVCACDSDNCNQEWCD